MGGIPESYSRFETATLADRALVRESIQRHTARAARVESLAGCQRAR